MIRYVVELARGLQRSAGVELHVIADEGAADWWAEELDSRDRVHPVRSLPVPVTSLLERRGWGLPTTDSTFDVVHGAKHLLPPASGALRLLTVHDMLPLDRPWDFGAAKRALLRGPYLASVREADAIVCVSAATRDRLCNYVPAAAEKAQVVGLAASSALLSTPSVEVPSLRGSRFALVVGDQSPRKNLPLVIGAWREVVAAVPDAVLAVVGPPGWGTTSLGPGVERLRREGSLQLLGHIGDGELRWCYEHARVAAMPSLLEGFGLPAVEARAFGAPLVTSEDPALGEASDGQARIVSTTRPDLWAAALIEAMSVDRENGSTAAGPDRSWDDVAGETMAVARAALAAVPAAGRREDAS
jgi:glycosyltransferase involved in cell wall biosynthesis